MQFPRIILMLSSKQAWFLYYLLKVVPGGTAKGLRTSLGDLLQALPKQDRKIIGK
ncbi:MAG: hypothetical protein BroJett011_76360 [Chloroflexota bacterium]|nr:MAG: hypothetical protein BroJett011_76360 [Chloroflexota bacterium]